MHHPIAIFLSACLGLALAASLACAQSTEYSALDAGGAAYAQADAARLLTVQRQILVNDYYRYYHYTPFDGAVISREPYTGALVYNFGQVHSHGLFGWPWRPQAQVVVPGTSPYGNYGRPWDWVRQPIGQQQMQTGPNRWESWPVYANEPSAVVPPARDTKPRRVPREF